MPKATGEYCWNLSSYKAKPTRDNKNIYACNENGIKDSAVVRIVAIEENGCNIENPNW